MAERETILFPSFMFWFVLLHFPEAKTVTKAKCSENELQMCKAAAKCHKAIRAKFSKTVGKG